MHSRHSPTSKVHASGAGVHEAELQHGHGFHMGLCWFRLLALVLLAWWVSHPSSYQFAVWKFLGFFLFGHLVFFCIGGGLLLFLELSEGIPRWTCWINFNYLKVYSLVDQCLSSSVSVTAFLSSVAPKVLWSWTRKFRWKWKTCCGWSLHVAMFHSSSLSWLGFVLSFFVIVIFLHRIFRKLGGWEYLWFA